MDLPTELPGFARETWLTLQRGDETVAWAVPCFSGRLKPVGRNVRGCLVGTSAGRLFFIGRKNFRARVVDLPLAGALVVDDPGAVFHRLAIRPVAGEWMRVRLTRRHASFVPAVLAWLQTRSRTAPAATVAPVLVA